MSQYASLEEFGKYGLPGVATSGLADADINDAIAGASAMADSYIANRGYSLPLTAWGQDLARAVCQIAAWDVLVHLRGVNPEDAAHAAIAKGRDDATAWLRDVAKGLANLSTVETTTARAKAGVARVFSVVGSDGESTRGW